ncbi:PAS domain S-box protein [Pontibacter ruber]|uniref:histidine kinase n=1 Tax=Pontibacter ruber TaxID=1343895 RepID=A0ABW5CYT3_9BACT|nr:PAS domain S-box protein [Pontibacter ruber]
MPYIPTRQPAEQLTTQANSLLQVLAQVFMPANGLLIALPSGQVLAANAQSINYLPSDTTVSKLNIRELLELQAIEDYDAFLNKLQDRKKVYGELPALKNSLKVSCRYTCQLMHFQDQSFICMDLSAADQLMLQEAVALDSYHDVFENSTEPLFILDRFGNFIDLNRSSLKLIGQQKELIVGMSISRSFGLSLFERIALRNQLQKAMNGDPQKFEWWLHEQNQELLPVEISLQKGTFNGEDVIFGSAKNLFEAVGAERNVRFRNHQLEFVNNLITNLSASGGKNEVLKYTLDELLEKSDVIGGCVYTYTPATGTAELLYTAGSVADTTLPADLLLPVRVTEQLLTDEKRKAVTELNTILQQKFQRSLTVVPVSTDQELLALLVVWSNNDTRITQSFLSLLDFIGTALGNYISRQELSQQLSYSEDKYKALFEASYEAILLFRDGKVVDCNERALQFFRCKREDLVGNTPIEFSPEFQPDGMRSTEKVGLLMKQILETGVPISFEWQNRRKDGTLFFAEINLNRVLIDGKYHVHAFKRDITQRKLAQSAQQRQLVLEQSMEQFRNFLEKVNLIYYSIDTKGRITYANDYFLNYVEYTEEEVVGKDFYEMLVPEKDREMRRLDFLKSLENKQHSPYYERDVVTKSGQLKTMRWNCMFEYNTDGEIIGVTSVGKDMTDKRIAMEALKDNKIRLQDLFDNAHDLIQNISVDNKFIFVNKAWKDRLGYTDHDIESLTLNDIVHPYYKAKLIYQLRNLYKGENVNKIETVFLTKAGKPVHLIGSITCSWQDGRPVATRAILHDITDRIKAERLQKVYYSIANLAISSKDLNSLYSAIHRELSKIIETRNIYIALCDKDRTHLNFVYLVDQFSDRSSKTHLKRPFSVGLSEYIIETGKPLYMQKADLLELSRKQNFSIQGAMPEVILCSPLAIGDRIIGVITLQDYQNPDAYVHTDIEILHFISNQVALAIERKRNEEQINTQNARLNAIFESGSHQMWSLNRNNELTSFNRNFANAFTERTGSTLQPFTHLFEDNMLPTHEGSADFWREKYNRAFAGQPQHFEVQLNYHEGWHEVYLNPIFLEDGSFDEISGIALDITDKKKSQLALSQSEEKFRHIFESFQDVYYRTTLDGRLELISPSVYNLLGYREEEVVGSQSNDFYVNPENRKLLKERVMAEKSIRDYEVEMICKDGTHKTVVLDSRLVTDEKGKPVYLEGVLRDVSELKRTQVALLKAKEEAENLLKVKTQFLANMSHELRTPMNGIIGMIDLLSQISNDEEQREYIDTLRKSSDALLAILNDILDLSKIQAGKLVISNNGIDLHDTLGKIHSLFANRAQQKDLTFTYSVTPDTPRYIQTDETRFLQILSNLTSNAIKFTNAGDVSILVDSTCLNKKGDYMLHVRVKDSGIGITPEDQQLLFTDFTQLDNSSTKTFGGTGLGLAISKQLAHLLGGDIGVDSTPGEGSTFWFNIRVRKANGQEVEEQLQRQSLQNAEVEVLENSPYVLLVDDNQINQKVAQKLLERLGCRMDIASNGFEAIALATTNKYNIIFMDIQMPEMDGITATGHIKEKLGDACPPIVAMTAYSMKDDADKFMSQGMDDYVSKPVKSSDLFAVISKWEEKSWYAQPEEAPAAEEINAPEPAAQSIIDEQVMEQLKMIGGDAFTQQLYTEFEEEAGQLLEEAKKDLKAQQYTSILSTLHQLKGTGFTLGINPLAELAKQLEHDIKQDRLESVDENFSKLLEQYELYRKAYKELII